jgi:hypothetical protein
VSVHVLEEVIFGCERSFEVNCCFQNINDASIDSFKRVVGEFCNVVVSKVEKIVDLKAW